MWDTSRLVSKGDYWYCRIPDHPNATELGYVFLHRALMENKLGRLLTSDEVVHHKDGNKKNNDISNLELMDRRSHARLHMLEQGERMCVLRCPNCYKIFEKSHRASFKKQLNTFGVFCSRSCSGKFSRYEQLHGLNKEMSEAIQKNLISVYIKMNTY